MRAGVVIGSPSRSVTSRAGIARVRCKRTPAGARRPPVPIVTWIALPDACIRSQTFAALQWLSSAPAPQANSAAHRLPVSPMSGCPTA